MPVSPLDTINFHTGDARRRQVHELIDIMSPREVPFLKLVGIDGEPGKNPKFEWLEDELLAESGALEGAHNNSTTSVVLEAGQGKNFQPYMLIKVNDEWMYVTAVSTDTLTVVRAVAGTSAAAHSDADKVEIIGLANRENVDAPKKGHTDLVIPHNFFQAFDTAYQISHIAANTEVYGVPQGDDERELEKAFEEIVIKLEQTAFQGRRRDEETVSGTKIPRQMGGLEFFLSKSGDTPAGPNDSGYAEHYQKDISSAQLTEKHINDMLADRWEKVGSQNMAKTLLVHSWNKRRINDMYAPYARMARNERTGGVIVDTIDTDWGPIDVVMSLRCPKDKVYLVNTEFIKIHPFNGLAFYDEEKASSGAYVVRQIYGVYTMSLRNRKAMGKIKGTATS